MGSPWVVLFFWLEYYFSFSLDLYLAAVRTFIYASELGREHMDGPSVGGGGALSACALLLDSHTSWRVVIAVRRFWRFESNRVGIFHV